MSWQLKRLPSLMIAALAALWLAAMPAWAESTFDQIKRTGELHYGAIDYPPNWFRDKTTGKWQGSGRGGGGRCQGDGGQGGAGRNHLGNLRA